MKKIQQHYSSDPQTNAAHDGIDFESFLSFCKDCGFLTGNGRISINLLHDIFHTCLVPIARPDEGSDEEAQKPAPKPRPPLHSPTDEAGEPHRLTPSQFLDAVIRISNAKYLVALPETLASRVKECVEKDILTGACRTVVDEFRKQLSSEAVRNVFKSHKGKLSTLFRRYATLETDQTRGGGTGTAAHTQSNKDEGAPPPPNTFQMSLPQFISLLTDAKIVFGDSGSHLGITLQRVKLLFKHVQQDDDHGHDADSDAGHSDQLTYQELLESLGALACWSYPDPFMPIAVKIAAFLENTLFPPIKLMLETTTHKETTTTTMTTK